MKSALSAVFALFAVSGSLMSAEDISVRNSSSFVGNGRWEWTLYIEATPTTLEKIKCVEYTLHPSFPNPLQVVCDRGQDEPFALHGSGWGEFNVRVRVTFSDRQPQLYNYWLKLTAAAKSELCTTAQSKLVQEDELWSLADPFRGIYVYAEVIHESRPSRLFFIKTRKTIDTPNFNWDSLKSGLKNIRKGVLGDEMLQEVLPKKDSLAAVQLPGSRVLSFFVRNPLRHRSIEIDICK